MKILSCYIENFGCLSSETVTFDEGLFIRTRPNGEGKSTLLAFLRAMLYGMEGLSAGDKRFKERLHYRPFGGGTYGGSLTIEYKGEHYRIERVFDAKSATKDTLTVYDGHGAQTDVLGDVPGALLFGLDEDAFARTAFMTAEDIDTAVPQSIGQRMCGFAFGSPKENDFASADKMLENACKELHSERKSRGEYTGAIPEKQRRLYERQAAYTNLKNKEAVLAEKQDARNRASEALRLANEKREQIRRGETVLAQFKAYDGHVARARAARETVDQLSLQYPHGIPSEEEISEYRRAGEALSRIDGAQSALDQSQSEEQSREQTLHARFEGGAPTDADMKEAWEALTSHGVACGKLAQLEAASVLAEQDRLIIEKFDARPIDHHTLGSLRRQREQLLHKQEELDALDAIPVRRSKGMDAQSLTAFLLAALLAMAGTVFCVLLLPLGITLLALTALSAAIGVLRLTSLRRRAERAEAAREHAARTLDAEIEAAYGTYANVLYRYGYDDPTVGLRLLENDAERYFALKDAIGKRTAQKAVLTEDKKRKEAFLSAFFTRYRTPIGEDMTQAYYELKRAKEDFAFFVQRRELSGKRTRDNEEKRKNLRAFRVALLQKYALNEEGFSPDLLTADREKLQNAQKTEKDEQAAAEKCRTEYALPNERPQPYEGDTAALDAEIEAKRQSVLRLDREVAEIEEDLEALGETAADIARTEESLQVMHETHACLRYAREELANARRDLLDRYVEPIRRSYLSYAEKISGVLCDGMSMTADLSCSFEWHGALHSANHLSMGQRSAMALCLRLALLDGMYDGEKPPLFLDDPFMALDRQHMESTLRILSELAKDRQIIYLTCHESRSPAQLLHN